MLTRFSPIICLSICFVLLFACTPSPTPPAPTQVSAAPQVLVQGNTTAEEAQTIELDNCNGKADAVRSEERGQSVDVTVSAEVAAKLGVSVEVIQAEVQTTVGAQVTDSVYRKSTIQLVAPPRTRMVFQIVWSGPEQVGIVQNLKSVGVPIAFRRFSPTDVKIKSQLDIGCATPGTDNTNTPLPTSPPEIPTQPPAATLIPTSTIAPTPTRVFATPTTEVRFPDIVVAGNAPNGIAFTVPSDGMYLFTIKSGTYCTKPGLCRSIIKGYINREIEWDNFYNLPHPMHEDEILGCWENDTAQNPSCGNGYSTMVSLRGGQYIRWVVMEDRNAFPDNSGSVILSVQKQ